MKLSKDQEPVKKTIRLPHDLNEEIEWAAKLRGISANAEIVDRLRAATVSDELARLSSEIAEVKAMVRQILTSVG